MLVGETAKHADEKLGVCGGRGESKEPLTAEKD
jgi:hypothetical protein